MRHKTHPEYVFFGVLLAGIILGSGFMTYKTVVEKKMLHRQPDSDLVYADTIEDVSSTPTPYLENINDQNPTVQPWINYSINTETNPLLQYLPQTGLDYDLYIAKKGEDLYSISEKYRLSPDSILWNNISVQRNGVNEGDTLLIPPTDGIFYFYAGEDVGTLAGKFNVSETIILNWNPLLQNGEGYPTILFIPGGKLVVDGSDQGYLITNPQDGCQITNMMVGSGFFMWPADTRVISGYTYDPPSHPAVDIGTNEGADIFASDNGVVVYAGSAGNYGNMVVIDHMNGYYTLYGHLSRIDATCNDIAMQGDVIGLGGNTGNSSGPHLHFEVGTPNRGHVDPMSVIKIYPE